MPNKIKYPNTDHKLKQLIINEAKKHGLSIADYSLTILDIGRTMAYNYVRRGEPLSYTLFKALYELHGIDIIAPLMNPEELLINMGKFYKETGYEWILDVVKETLIARGCVVEL